MNTDLFVDQALYPIESIMGAAYVFTQRCYVLLDRAPDGKVKVSLAAKPGTSAEALSTIAGEFENELLAQSLRKLIAVRHEKVREVIVARALFGAAPQMPEEPTAPLDDAQLGVDPKFVPANDDDFLEDPLGIAVPWEEKYAQGSGAPAAGAAPTSGGSGRETKP